MIDDLRALSVRQPWALAIVHGDKDIENRTRCYARRGLTLIHASAGCTPDEIEEFVDFVRARRLGRWNQGVQNREIERGGIIGAVDILDCVERSDSPWFVGPKGYVVANARPIPFIPCKGTVTPLFWLPPLEVRERSARSLGLLA